MAIRVKRTLNADEQTVSLLLRMQTLAPSMSKAEQRVTMYVLDHPNDAISLSVAGLAERIGVSDATVVRTCKTLGMRSYQDFKVTLARDTAVPLQASPAYIEQDDSPETIVDKVFQDHIHTLEYTRSVIDSKLMCTAANRISACRRALIIGLGNSGAVAMDLEHKLLRIGINAHAFADTHMQMIASIDCCPEDVVIAISHSGSTIDIVNCAKACRARGAFIIALTNRGRSPLSRTADLTLMTASQETEQNIFSLASRIAQMTIVDCLYNIIVSQRDDISERFYEMGKALERFKY